MIMSFIMLVHEGPPFPHTPHAEVRFFRGWRSEKVGCRVRGKNVPIGVRPRADSQYTCSQEERYDIALAAGFLREYLCAAAL